MKLSLVHVIGAFLLPVVLAQSKRATNSSSFSTTGLLSSGAVALGDWDAAYQKAVGFLGQMTNEQKLSLITGSDVDALNWTALVMKDGTQGPNVYNYETGFSEGSAIVYTWDKNLISTQFSAVAAEFYDKGIQVAQAPTSQTLGRTPWSGRLVEGLSPDSYLNGIAFGLGAKAISDVGVISCGKHFLLNEQETNRQSSGSSTSDVAPYTSNVDDKTLHETYMFPFYDGIKNGMGTVMCAMTKVNGTLSCENENLLQELLKTEIGFPGMVTPDVNGQGTAYGSAQGGLDYGSSSYWSNATAIRNVIGYFYVNLNNGSQPASVSTSAYVDVRGNHSQVVRTTGSVGMVLLKNTNNALPLSKPLSIAIFGAHAGSIMVGPNYPFTVLGSGPVYQGHLAGASGSETTSFSILVTPHYALTTKALADGTMLRWILNDTYTAEAIAPIPTKRDLDTTTYGNDTGSSSSGGGGGDSFSGGTWLTQTYAGYATDASVCLVFINAMSGEGADRTELRNTDQDTMVNTVAANCNNTVVVLNTVGPRILDSWIENENVTAILYGSLLGEQSGNSIIDVLYGDVNPSGRLIHTIAKNESDYNVLRQIQCNPTLRIWVRFIVHNVQLLLRHCHHHQRNRIRMAYPTGILAVGGKTDFWDEIFTVNVTINNTGSLDGNEVAQLYVEFPDEADAPVRSLRGFEKVLIASGASTKVDFALRRRDLSYWDVVAQDWKIATGEYTFSVGASSRDLRANITMTLGS
ncbi:glycoside hydrolase family 3 protein [Mollisia scopiformis]|uniref:beta-glucosidase n=1 Tax=Mollisia scopiformis TaxID=149040 RepID=A0A194WZ37_MOLSC|nr:glycoside hydrolase family 3 protein [Mollisia scopiformis]KUJ13220.1 glycoside hydrolase family 3 protein [Mollisia scopiformis]